MMAYDVSISRPIVDRFHPGLATILYLTGDSPVCYATRSPENRRVDFPSLSEVELPYEWIGRNVVFQQQRPWLSASMGRQSWLSGKNYCAYIR